MDIASLASLGFRTDLALLTLSGSRVEDRGTHLVVRTPDNPTFWWGNFLLLPGPPADEAEARGWLAQFEAAFPDAEHRTLGIDGADRTPADAAAFAELGLDVEPDAVMTATDVRPPARPNTDATFRPLASDRDWAEQVELSLAGEEGPGYDLEFCLARAEQHRRLVEQRYGVWWGAFEGDRLLASLGLFTASPGLARFQTVKTHPDARNRGLAGTLVHRAGRHGLDELGARTLVMVADPAYVAIRVYRAVGFRETQNQIGVTRKPPE